MKNCVKLFTACVLSWHAAFAQSAFERASLVLQPGIGYGLIGTEGEVGTPPVSLCVEYGASENWSIGGYVGYASSRFVFANYANTYGLIDESGLDFSYMIFGGRLSYHLAENEKVDTYAGVMLGYNSVSVKEFGDVPRFQALAGKASDLLYGGQLGVRYFVSPNFAFFAEAGYGIGYITAGISLKIQDEPREMKATSLSQRLEDLSLEIPDEDGLLQAQIIDGRKQHFIINLGRLDGLKPGMMLQIYQSLGGAQQGAFYGSAEVIEVRAHNAIIKMEKIIGELLVAGDQLAVKLAKSVAGE